MPNRWYVITGGPSSGKTTLLDELKKLGYTTVDEAARLLIDEALGRGITVEKLRADEERFQYDVLKLKEKTEKAQAPDTITFFDRGMHDSLAYLRYYDFKIDSYVNKMMQMAKYRKVFLLEPLASYEEDYARIEDKDFAERISQLLDEAYSQYGMRPIRVGRASVPERLKFIFDHLKEREALGG